MFFRAIYLNKTTVLIGQSEGSPNITGVLGPMEGTTTPSGAFYKKGTGMCPSTSYAYRDIVLFDASKGETKIDGTLKAADELHVYGNSNHVTPYNTTIKVWQRIS